MNEQISISDIPMQKSLVNTVVSVNLEPPVRAESPKVTESQVSGSDVGISVADMRIRQDAEIQHHANRVNPQETVIIIREEEYGDSDDVTSVQ